MARTWYSVTVELLGGRIVTDGETGDEMVSSMGGPLASPLDLEAAKVARTVSLGEEFQYTFRGAGRFRSARNRHGIGDAPKGLS